MQPNSAGRRKFLEILLLMSLAVPAEHAVARAAVGRAIARRVLAGGAATRAGATHLGKPVDIYVRRSQYPTAAAHIDRAQKLGQPTVLTLDRRGAATRRHDSLYGVGKNGARPGRGFDRDEYPPALTREGGSGASVNFIPSHDNRGAGHAIASQVRELPDGARVRVIVTE